MVQGMVCNNGVAKKNFQFSNDNLLYDHSYNAGSGSPSSYTFTKAYKKCLVIAARYTPNGGYPPDISCSNCTQTSESVYPMHITSGGAAYAYVRAFIVEDIAVGSVISSSYGIAIYAMEE